MLSFLVLTGKPVLTPGGRTSGAAAAGRASYYGVNSAELATRERAQGWLFRIPTNRCSAQQTPGRLLGDCLRFFDIGPHAAGGYVAFLGTEIGDGQAETAECERLDGEVEHFGSVGSAAMDLPRRPHHPMLNSDQPPGGRPHGPVCLCQPRLQGPSGTGGRPPGGWSELSIG